MSQEEKKEDFSYWCKKLGFDEDFIKLCSIVFRKEALEKTSETYKGLYETAEKVYSRDKAMSIWLRLHLFSSTLTGNFNTEKETNVGGNKEQHQQICNILNEKTKR